MSKAVSWHMFIPQHTATHCNKLCVGTCLKNWWQEFKILSYLNFSNPQNYTTTILQIETFQSPKFYYLALSHSLPLLSPLVPLSLSFPHKNARTFKYSDSDLGQFRILRISDFIPLSDSLSRKRTHTHAHAHTHTHTHTHTQIWDNFVPCAFLGHLNCVKDGWVLRTRIRLLLCSISRRLSIFLSRCAEFVYTYVYVWIDVCTHVYRHTHAHTHTHTHNV